MKEKTFSERVKETIKQGRIVQGKPTSKKSASK